MTNHDVYRSKIGRLPFAMRNELNSRIRDGVPTKRLIEWLNSSAEFHAVQASEGCAPINDQNLSEWKKRGYQFWLRAQGRSSQIRELRDESLRILESSGGSPATVGARIIMGRLLELLEEADQEELLHIGTLVAKLRAEETKAQQLALASEKSTIDRKRLELEQAKFQRQTCDLFMEWAQSDAARAILDDRSTDTDAKTEALGRLMFGDLWRGGK